MGDLSVSVFTANLRALSLIPTHWLQQPQSRLCKVLFSQSDWGRRVFWGSNVSFLKTNIPEFLKILAFNKLHVELLLSQYFTLLGGHAFLTPGTSEVLHSHSFWQWMKHSEVIPAGREHATQRWELLRILGKFCFHSAAYSC